MNTNVASSGYTIGVTARTRAFEAGVGGPGGGDRGGSGPDERERQHAWRRDLGRRVRQAGRKCHEPARRHGEREPVTAHKSHFVVLLGLAVTTIPSGFA